MFPHYSGTEQVQFELFAVQLVNLKVLGDINREGELSSSQIYCLLLSTAVTILIRLY